MGQGDLATCNVVGNDGTPAANGTSAAKAVECDEAVGCGKGLPDRAGEGASDNTPSGPSPAFSDWSAFGLEPATPEKA
jgi:hypothetical protein